jgi:ribonuclease G
VVEISPLGLVEMTRQNVTDGPREILTRRCTVCGGDGIVLSEASAAVDAERRLRTVAAGAPRTKAFKIELNAKVASILIGPGAARLAAIEEETRRRFLIESREDVPVDHFEVLGKGTLESLSAKGPVEEGTELELKLVEVGLHDLNAAVGKLDGIAVSVGNAAPLVGKKAKVRIERVLDGMAYATLLGGATAADVPITAEGEAEKPTRKPPARKGRKPKQPEKKGGHVEADVEAVSDEAEDESAPEPAAETPDAGETAEAAPKKKKTRRGSRGGKRRRKKPAGEAAATANGEGPKIHLPDPGLGKADAPKQEQEPERTAAVASEDGTEAPKPKKKTRRGSRGGRKRRKPAAGSASSTASE